MEDSLKRLVERYGYEVFVLILLILSIFAIVGGVGVLILKIILSLLTGFLALLIGEEGLKKAFSLFGLRDYYRTATILSFIIIGLWNWFATFILLIILSAITLISGK